MPGGRVLDVGYKGDMPEADIAFAQGLADARPVEELAAELGWSKDKVRRKLKDANVLALASSEGLATTHGILIPASLRLVEQLINDTLFVHSGEKGFHQSKRTRVPVPLAIRLDAAKTVLKMARFEEYSPPSTENDPLDGATPDRLRGLLDVIESRLADLATPVSAQIAPNAPVTEAVISSDYSVLD